MDLAEVAYGIRVDLLTIAVSRTLAAAGVRHVLLKGPTTAAWLYDPPRPYADVDVLVPLASVSAAVGALTSAGVATATAGRLGEEASHSLQMVSSDNIELDLHVTLPSLPTPTSSQSERLWRGIAPHLVTWSLDGKPVPALNIPARCLVLSLHALNSGPGSTRVLEDLRRAWQRASPQDWDQARALARLLELEPELAAGLSLLSDTPPDRTLPVEALLRVTGASGPAIQLGRLSHAPLLKLPGLLWREAFPSANFMRFAQPALGERRLALWLAYLRRLGRLLRALPLASRQLTKAYRQRR